MPLEELQKNEEMLTEDKVAGLKKGIEFCIQIMESSFEQPEKNPGDQLYNETLTAQIKADKDVLTYLRGIERQAKGQK